MAGLVETLKAAGRRSAFVHNWEPLRDLSRPESLAYSSYREPVYDETCDDWIAPEAARLIADGSFDFIFVYFGSVDLAGHGYGWMSPEYLAQLHRVDALLGTLLAALPDGASLIAHSDHGGHGRTHGTDSDEDMTIPWLAAGPAIRPGHQIVAPVSLLDTAPAVARLLGVAPPPSWEGRAPEEIFL